MLDVTRRSEVVKSDTSNLDPLRPANSVQLISLVVGYQYPSDVIGHRGLDELDVGPTIQVAKLSEPGKRARMGLERVDPAGGTYPLP